MLCIINKKHMVAGGVFHFAYMLSDDRLDLQRDKPAFEELVHILCPPFSYPKSQTILNRPGIEVDLNPIVTDNGILVLTTRPPLHDAKSYDRRKVDRSGTETESRILSRFIPFFDNLSRGFVLLNSELCRKLKNPEFAAIKYRVNLNGDIYSIQRRELFYFERRVDENYHKTVGYIILLQASETLPRTLAVWACNGENNYIFSILLRNGLWNKLNINLLSDSAIAMVSFSTNYKNKLQKADFSWVTEEVDYDVVLNASI
jgi:hypothetical protein